MSALFRSMLSPIASALSATARPTRYSGSNSLQSIGSLWQQQVRTATKRGGGSSKNGRSSAGRRLGVKKFTDQYVLPGQIIVRQRGNQFHAGQDVGQGKDHTLYALEPGYVKFYSSSSPFPHVVPSTSTSSTSVVKRPRYTKQFIGITREREERLPRALQDVGRDRRFWGAVKEETV
ncbi:54S ribosomal protein L2 mitochondrial [Naganishia albida]|nr:54S ribosomal protein L2 mitochondrial [Naganishia albida]